ncbi:hypothetical protein [Dietzia sp. UCD-THP]|uniref:hypothetical protein n=1 Tax=Dietzia sp. UCD-THP TaxID=1292020 RepID=UPI0004CF8A77|nr:hypothetical protein [Dietzia sp. UCD-THP]
MTSSKARREPLGVASAYAKRSPRWIRQRLVDGRLTAFKSGHDDRLVLIDLDELDELLRVRPA